MGKNLRFEKVENNASSLKIFGMMLILLVTVPYPLTDYTRSYFLPAIKGTNLPENVDLTISLKSLAIPQSISRIGSFTMVTNLPTNANLGGILLLSEGTVIAKSADSDGNGKEYYKLTPGASGRYVHRAWSTIISMNYDRLYYPAQQIKDDHGYASGGKYDNRLTHGDIHDATTNALIFTPYPEQKISNANVNRLRLLQQSKAYRYESGG